MEKQYDVWLKIGKTYKCGCCGRIPCFVDIRDLTTCPHCEHMMNYYETDEGPKLLRPDGSVWQNKVGILQYTDNDGYVAVRPVQVN
jgi:hypothetical protein